MANNTSCVSLKNKRIITIKSYILCLLLCANCYAQEEELDKDLLYSDVRVLFTDGDLYGGFLSGVRDDSLIFIIGGNHQAVSYKNIRMLDIQREGGNLDHSLTGFFSGILLGNILFYTGEDNTGGKQPTAFAGDYPEGIGAVLINLVFGAAGMLIGYVFDLSSHRHRQFDFPDNDESRIAKWNSLRNFLIGGHSKRIIHLSFHAGHVSNRIRDVYKKSLEDAGFGEYYDYEQISFFNFLRKIQLLVEIKEKIRVGAAVIWQGEPALSLSNYGYGNARLTNEAVGYYGLCTYQPINKIPFYMGAGIGLVDAQWHIYGSSQRDDPFFESLPFDVSLEKSLFSGVIFADYHLKLNEFSFFSLYFDHTFTSAQDFPEIPEIYLTKYKRSYGNTSFGVSLGLSF